MGRSHRTRRRLRWLLRLRGSPEAIARGVAAGMFVAFTPTVGVQSILALLLATAVGANRPVSLVPLWITNPATLVPVYGFVYWVGSFFWPGPPLADVGRALGELAKTLARLDALALRESLVAFAGIGGDVFAALWVGGVVVGLLTSGAVYLPTVWLVREARRRWQRRPRRRQPRVTGG